MRSAPFPVVLDHCEPVPESGCWLWSGATYASGYGAFRRKGKNYLTHRVAYEQAFGPVPDGMLICHRCDVRSCCNPSHLFVGTYTDNNRDMGKKGRAVTPSMSQTHCKNGHELANNRYVEQSGRSHGCLICHTERRRSYYLKKIKTDG